MRAIGAVRCWQIAKQLARLGWEVEVVTLDPDLLSDPEPGLDVLARCAEAGVRLRRTGHAWRVLRGSLVKLRWWEPRAVNSLFRRLADRAWVDGSVGWVRSALAACKNLQPGQVDLILASGPPFTAFQAAAALAARLRVPYILDYRDLWSQTPHPACRPPRWVQRQERALLAGAAGVVVVSEGMARSLQDGFTPPVPATVVTNGFDPAEYADVVSAPFDDFAVVYTGRFYPPWRVAEPLVVAADLANRRSSGARPVRLHYFGSDGEHVTAAARQHRAENSVTLHGKVTRASALAAVKGASVAAIVTSVHTGGSGAEDGILPGKLYEAAALGTPALVVAPKGAEIERVMAGHGLGRAFPAGETDSMAEWLLTMRNDSTARPRAAGPDNWNWAKTLGPRLAAYLEGRLGGRPQAGSEARRNMAAV